VVIPKSVTPSRIAENFNVWDFRLDKDELGEIAKLDQNKRLGRSGSVWRITKKPDSAGAYPAWNFWPGSASATGQCSRINDRRPYRVLRASSPSPRRSTLMHNRRMLGQRRTGMAVLATRFAHFVQRRRRYQAIATRANQVLLPMVSSA
jgi:hypothetical protein